MAEFDGTTPVGYMTDVDAMTVRGNGQLIVAGSLRNDGTDTYGLHTFDGTNWITLQSHPNSEIRCLAIVSGYPAPNTEHIHYGGNITHTTPENESFRATYEWDFTSSVPVAHGFDEFALVTDVYVTSIVQFESSGSQESRVWCARGLKCGGTLQGAGQIDLPDVCWLGADGEWKHEDVNPTFATTRPFGGLLAVDYSTRVDAEPTLVFAYSHMCVVGDADHEGYGPWYFYDEAICTPVICPDRWPRNVVIRRSHNVPDWAGAASEIRGNVRALGSVQLAPGEFRFFVAGDSFFFEGIDLHDPELYHHAGVWSCADVDNDGDAEGWEHGRGRIRDTLGPNFPDLPEPDGGTVYAFCRNGSPCFYAEEAVFGGVFRGVWWFNRDDETGNYERRAAQIAVYGQHRNDFDQDGSADFFDYDAYFLCFQDPTCTDADFNCDGTVDFFDYDDWVTWFEFNDNP
jgi:hypothetical protein